jgi:hypothetical protein
VRSYLVDTFRLAVRWNRIGRFKSRGSRVVELRPGRLVAALCVIVSTLMPVSAAMAGPDAKFVSKLYGYSLVLPGSSSQWQAAFAHVTWLTGRVDPDLPAFDTFTNVQTQRAYLIGARRPPTGSTLEKWTSFVISMRPPHCLAAPTSRIRDSMLSGAPARLFTFSCTDGYIAIGITALHAHRGYFMFVATPTSISRASDRHAFDAARRSFRFLGK